MDKLRYKGQVMWSQVDANMHLRHSAYADFGAHARLVLMESMGFNARLMKQLHLGPILFREETIYRKEIQPNENIEVSSFLSKCRKDGSRWSIKHEIFKENGEIAAIINVDGAWMNVVLRKLDCLPQEYADIFLTMPKTEEFVLE